MPLNDTSFSSEQDILNVSGSISASLIDPATGAHVAVDSGSLKVTGSVFVINSETATIGTVTQGASGSIPWKMTGSVAIDNFPAVQAITGSVTLGEQPIDVTGSVALSEAVPPGENKIGKVSLTDISGSNEVAVILDVEDDINRLAIFGKVSVTVAPPPEGGTSAIFAADNPLSVNGTEDIDFVLPDGEVLHVQQVVAGAAGDPNEKGSVVEIFYIDTSSVSHLIERIYVSGFTEFGNYPDTSLARDGTLLVGDTAGTDALLRIRRRRVGGAAAEIDAVLRGYTV